MKKNLLIGLVLILIAFSLYLIFNSRIENNENDTLVFLGNKNIAPIIYQEDGKAKGVVVDISKGLAEKMGAKIQIEATDWTEAQNRVLSGEADALLQINPNPEREKLYDFSDVLLKSEFSIFINSGEFGIKTIDDLNGKRVGVESGGYPYYLLNNYDGINIVLIPNWDKAFQMIKSGEIDAVVVDRWIGEYELSQHRIAGIKVVEEPIENQYSRIAVKKGNDQLLDSINDGLQALHEDGTMNKVLNNWSGEQVVYLTERFITKSIFYFVIVILLLIILISLFWMNKFRKLSIKLESDVMQRTKELQDINEQLQQTNKKLQQISLVDGLTGIANRRHFDSTLKKLWNVCKRESKPLALIMADIDFFKHFNDTQGHLAGDECLKKVAGLIKSTVNRPYDCVARFGGEEFAVLLYNTSEDGAEIIAEKIRTGVANLGIENGDRVITVSLGVASLIPNNDNTPEELISAADQALYQAKKDGRNKIKKNSIQ